MSQLRNLHVFKPQSISTCPAERRKSTSSFHWSECLANRRTRYRFFLGTTPSDRIFLGSEIIFRDRARNATRGWGGKGETGDAAFLEESLLNAWWRGYRGSRRSLARPLSAAICHADVCKRATARVPRDRAVRARVNRARRCKTHSSDRDDFRVKSFDRDCDRYRRSSP